MKASGSEQFLLTYLKLEFQTESFNLKIINFTLCNWKFT